ncbi:MAG: hypothetical protein AAGJ18_06900 [Bacteroidota bacterium]
MAAITALSHLIPTFYESVFTHFSKAKRENDTQAVDLKITNFWVRLEIVGTVLPSIILPAFTHLPKGEQQQPDLTIHVWDSRSTRMPLLSFPWPISEVRAQGMIRGYNNAAFDTGYCFDTHGLKLLDRKNNRGFFWMPDAHQIPYYIQGAPLKNVLHWWLRHKNIVLTHAGAVGNQKGSVLLVGKGGAGKSTSAIACLGSNLQYLGDDYCWTTPREGGAVYSAFCSAKVEQATLDKFPLVQNIFSGIESIKAEKYLYFLQQKYGEQIMRRAPLKGIFVPSIYAQRNSFLEVISPAKAMKSLIPSSLFQIAGTGKQEFSLLARLVQQVPCFQLHLGTDLAQIPQIIEHFLNTSHESTTAR